MGKRKKRITKQENENNYCVQAFVASISDKKLVTSVECFQFDTHAVWLPDDTLVVGSRLAFSRINEQTFMVCLHPLSSPYSILFIVHHQKIIKFFSSSSNIRCGESFLSRRPTVHMRHIRILSFIYLFVSLMNLYSHVSGQLHTYSNLHTPLKYPGIFFRCTSGK